MNEIRRIGYAEILSQPRLLDNYSAECSIPEIGIPNPQADMYAKMEESGMMKCFGAFSNDVLIGFASILFSVLPHYGKKVAIVESLFVAQLCRESGAGKELMKAIESEAKGEGCVVMLYSATTDSQLEKVLSIRKDCRRTNAVFTRVL